MTKKLDRNNQPPTECRARWRACAARWGRRRGSRASALLLLLLGSLPSLPSGVWAEAMPGGELRVVAPDGAPAGICPLEHTDVDAQIAGFVGRVRVRQTFHNPSTEKIEAVYVFPLPDNAAVDRMTMSVGDRKIEGLIKRRDEARDIYEQARRAGHVSSLLDQERPNIFTQSVANIEPGERVVIEISYVETLGYEDGVFEFVFPMVVGPRYMPGTPVGKQGSGWAPDTSQVPDASRISPPVAPPGTRAGHDLSLRVDIDAGMPLYDVESVLHEIDVVEDVAGRATVMLADRTVLPNKDFVLRYRTATEEIGDAFLSHTDARGTYFTLILEPPRRVRPAEARPKEMIFVIDRSGSMSGFPIEKAKETMRLAIEQMNPRDTFNLLSFAGGTGRCFEKPVSNTPENRATALRYLADLYGSGGTEMMPAILSALEGAPDPERVRIVAFMTDGYIGDDFAIIDAVQKNAQTARVFAFGIGNSVNRFLLDGMAHAGRGEAEFVTLESEGDAAVQRFHERIHSPVLTDIEIDWGTLPVADVYPRHIPDLFSVKPLMIHGRLTAPGDGTVTLRGETATGNFERSVRVRASKSGAAHDALATIWARAAVRDLMMQDYAALQAGTVPDAVREEITTLGLEFRLMTQFTSFVAVEEMTVTVGGAPRTIAVPVEIPDGVSYDGIFGEADAVGSTLERHAKALSVAAAPIAPATGGGLWKSEPLREAARGSAGVVGGDGRIRQDEAEQAALVNASAEDGRFKLSEPLRGLAERVAKDGKEGRLDVAGLSVDGYRVDVMIYLSELSADVLRALAELGFHKAAESKGTNLVVGSIDVRKLEALAKLASVARVTTVPTG